MRFEKRRALGAGVGFLALLALVAGIAACGERIVVGTELVDEPNAVVPSGADGADGADGGAEGSPADDDEESGDEDEESDEDDDEDEVDDDDDDEK